MADEQEWLTEEGWSRRNRFWYLYHSSPQNSLMFFQIKILINILGIYPVILGCFLIDRAHVNDVAYALARLSDVLSFWSFVPSWLLAIALFTVNVPIAGVMVFGYLRPLSMLNARFGAVVRFLFETVAGSSSTIVFPAVIRMLVRMKHGGEDVQVWHLVLAATALVLNWWVTTEYAFFNMNSTYFLGQFYGQWNGMNLHTIVILPSTICFVLLFDSVKVQRVVFCAVQLVEMVVYFRWNLMFQFVVPGFNVSYMVAYSFVWLLSLIWALNWFVWELDIVTALVLLVVAFCVSVVFSLRAFNYQSDRFLKLIEVKPDMEIGWSEICEKEGKEHKFEFPMEVANDKRSVFVLRYLLSVGDLRILEFALFLFENTDVMDIKMEAMRLLVVLDAVTDEVREELVSLRREDVKLSHVQLLFSMKAEALGMNQPILQANMDKLMYYKDEVRKALLKIAYMIECGDFEGGKLALETYTHWCDAFEECASMCYLQSPNSQPLHTIVSEYYSQMKGDHVVGNAWKLRGESLGNAREPKQYSSLSQRDMYSFSAIRARIPFHTVGRLVEDNVLESGNDSALSRTNSVLNDLHSPVEKKVKIALPIVVGLCIFSFVYQADRVRAQMSVYRDVAVVLWKFPMVIICYALMVLDFTMNLLISACGTDNKCARVKETIAMYATKAPNYSQELALMFQNMTNIEKIVGQTSLFGTTDVAKLWRIHGVFSPKFDMTLMTLYSDVLHDASVPATNESYEIWDKAVTQLETLYENLVACDNRLLDVFSVIADSNYYNFRSVNTFLAFVVLLASLIIVYFLFVLRQTTIKSFWDTFCAIDSQSLETFQENINKGKELDAKTELDDDIVLLDDDEMDDAPCQCTPGLECITENEDTEDPDVHRKELPMILDLVCVVGMAIFIILSFILPVSQYVLANTDIELDVRKGAVLLSEIGMDAMRAVRDLFMYTERHTTHVRLNSSNQFRVLESGAIFGRSIGPVSPWLGDVYDDHHKLQQFFWQFRENISHRQSNQTSELDSEILKIIGNVFTNFSHHYVTMRTWRSEMQEFLFDNALRYHNIFMCIGSIHVVFGLILALHRVYYTTVQFEAFKSLLKLFCAQHISSLSEFLKYVDPSLASKQQCEFRSGENRYIVKQSLDAIIILSRDQVIQDVNASAKALTKYGKAQLIGMQIATIIDKNSGDDGFLVQLDLLMNDTVKSSCVSNMFNLTLKQKDGGLLPCSCVLIVLKTEYRPQDEGLPACAIVLRDRTFYTEQEQFLQIAQKRVETLLYRILPRVMATKLLSANNQQLTSKVPRATVIFIGIVNFLEWCRSHTHTEIIELLDLIFSNFDEMITEFPTLVKLKVINGTYMAAGGLFNEASPKGHEVEAVEFALKCAASIARRNALTGSHLQLTVGINTGGPVIAGILGIDKPLFDIWGDAVNVSSRLQTSCPKDFIQMSRETYEALPEGMFNITERDGVFLKGKGIATTFVIDCRQPPKPDQNCM